MDAAAHFYAPFPSPPSPQLRSEKLEGGKREDNSVFLSPSSSSSSLLSSPPPLSFLVLVSTSPSLFFFPLFSFLYPSILPPLSHPLLLSTLPFIGLSVCPPLSLSI